MARPKGSVSLASRLMGGQLNAAGIYAEDPEGKQVYVHAMWRRDGAKGRLKIGYVGQGAYGRAGDASVRKKEHAAFLRQHWIGRTLLFAKPRRLEDLKWLELQFAEFQIPDGLVVIETPFLKEPRRVEARLIEIYKETTEARFNQVIGNGRNFRFNPVPNRGCLKEHAADIRQRKAAGEGTNALAREFGVDPSSIRYIIRGDSYKDA